jgi:hypothetical protein
MFSFQGLPKYTQIGIKINHLAALGATYCKIIFACTYVCFMSVALKRRIALPTFFFFFFYGSPTGEACGQRLGHDRWAPHHGSRVEEGELLLLLFQPQQHQGDQMSFVKKSPKT